MATPDPAVLAELTAQCRSSSRPQGVIFLGQAIAALISPFNRHPHLH
jgi:hypothetical protein